MKKIMVPLDGSPLGELALDYAVKIAISLRAELNLVTVSENREKEHERLYSLYLDKITEQLTETLHKEQVYLQVTATVTHGKPADTLVKYALKHNVSMLIIVSHGRSGIMPWSAGSTATKVIHKSTLPVLLVRANEPNLEGNGFERILLPLDGSPIGESAIPLVKDLALASNSEVLILRVVEPVQQVHTIGGIDHFIFTDEQAKRMEEEVGAYLKKVRRQFVSAGIAVKTIIKTGDPALEILKISEAEKINLVAMSSHGRSGIAKWILGSVSNKILQAGKKPLLIVRPLYKNVT